MTDPMTPARRKVTSTDPPRDSGLGTDPAADAPPPSRSRLDRFTDEIATLRLKTGRSSIERRLQLVGATLMLGGIIVALAAYITSLDVTATPGTNVDVLNASSYVVLAITGLGVSVVGGFIFLRYSLAAFLRLWLLRQSYEQQTLLDVALDGRAPSTIDAGARDTPPPE